MQRHIKQNRSVRMLTPKDKPEKFVEMQYANAYEARIELVSEFWVDKSSPDAFEKRVARLRKDLAFSLYGHLLPDIYSIRNVCLNGDAQEAVKLLDALETKLLNPTLERSSVCS
jgi:hypothetical protein